MFKIEYDIVRDDEGNILIKLSEDYKNLPEHKLLYFIMSSHLLNMAKNNVPDIDETEMDSFDFTIEFLNEVAQEVNLILLSEDIKVKQNTIDTAGIVTNTVKNLNELKTFKLGDQYDEENKLEVQIGTTFYNRNDKQKYVFNENHEWIKYVENN
ncbi:MAG: hypothetical protein ACOCVF_00685 [bacterium]